MFSSLVPILGFCAALASSQPLHDHRTSQATFAAPDSPSTSSSEAHINVDGNFYLNSQLPSYIFNDYAQYGVRYTVPSSLSPAVPEECKVTLVNSLERHGARYMSGGTSKDAHKTVEKIQKALRKVKKRDLPSELRFLKDVEINGGTEDLVPYGALQLYESGKSTRELYKDLVKGDEGAEVFIRTTGLGSSDRVIVSSQYWSMGYFGQDFPSETLTNGQEVREAGVKATRQPDVIFWEGSDFNNTLDISTCNADNEHSSDRGEKYAVKKFGKSTLVPTIGKRLEKALRKAGAKKLKLKYKDITSLSNLCTAETLTGARVSDGGQLDVKVSDFCGIFKPQEWEALGYALDVGKYYGSGYGDPYHRSLAVGYLRELYARLTGTEPILSPPTSLNTTLDSSPETFALPSEDGPRIFFDGSHDNNISPIVAAFGLFDSSEGKLSLKENAQDSYASRHRAWHFGRIVPLGGKVVWEKLECQGGEEEYVRVRVNGAIQVARGQPWCPDGADDGEHQREIDEGLCPLGNVLSALDWIKDAEVWDRCYQKYERQD